MDKIKKKSINKIMEIYKNSKSDVILTLTDPISNDVVMEVAVRNSLTIDEKGAFVDRVVNSCFNEDGDFLPQYIDPVFVITLLQMTTNVPVFEKVLKSDEQTESGEIFSIVDIEKTYDLCKAIDLRKNIDDAKYQALVIELKQMVEDKIAYKKAVNARRCPNSLTILKPVVESIEKATGGMSVQEILEKLDSAIRAIQSSEDNVVPFVNGK